MVYNNAKTLAYILFEEGAIRMTTTLSGTNFPWEYNLKDHLGNTRVLFMVGITAPARLVQVSDYYPFGQTFAPLALNSSANKYLYNVKELQDDKLGGSTLNMLEYGAMFYDAAAVDFKTDKIGKAVTNIAIQAGSLTLS